MLRNAQAIVDYSPCFYFNTSQLHFYASNAYVITYYNYSLISFTKELNYRSTFVHMMSREFIEGEMCVSWLAAEPNTLFLSFFLF